MVLSLPEGTKLAIADEYLATHDGDSCKLLVDNFGSSEDCLLTTTTFYILYTITIFIAT